MINVAYYNVMYLAFASLIHMGLVMLLLVSRSRNLGLFIIFQNFS